MYKQGKHTRGKFSRLSMENIFTFLYKFLWTRNETDFPTTSRPNKRFDTFCRISPLFRGTFIHGDACRKPRNSTAHRCFRCIRDKLDFAIWSKFNVPSSSALSPWQYHSTPHRSRDDLYFNCWYIHTDMPYTIVWALGLVVVKHHLVYGNRRSFPGALLARCSPMVLDFALSFYGMDGHCRIISIGSVITFLRCYLVYSRWIKLYYRSNLVCFEAA